MIDDVALAAGTVELPNTGAIEDGAVVDAPPADPVIVADSVDRVTVLPSGRTAPLPDKEDALALAETADAETPLDADDR